MSASSSRPAEARAPATPRPAATVILLRSGPAGDVETFLVRRDPRSRFAANACVFPGGTVHTEDLDGSADVWDESPTADEAHRRLGERGGEAPESPRLSLALHRAALRELFEEAGVLLARDAATGALVRPDPTLRARLEEARLAFQAGRETLSAIVARLGLRLTVGPLVYFSHWITPETSPIRFDTRFFVLEQPDGQEASHCGVETVEGAWMTPAAAIERFERGEIALVMVTLDHLRLLSRFGSVAELLAFARTKLIRTICPRRRDGGWDLGADDGAW